MGATMLKQKKHYGERMAAVRAQLDALLDDATREAVAALGALDLHKKDEVAVLAHLAEHPDEAVRVAVVGRLDEADGAEVGDGRHPGVLPTKLLGPLFQTLLEDGAERVRHLAASALAAAEIRRIPKKKMVWDSQILATYAGSEAVKSGRTLAPREIPKYVKRVRSTDPWPDTFLTLLTLWLRSFHESLPYVKHLPVRHTIDAGIAKVCPTALLGVNSVTQLRELSKAPDWLYDEVIRQTGLRYRGIDVYCWMSSLNSKAGLPDRVRVRLREELEKDAPNYHAIAVAAGVFPFDEIRTALEAVLGSPYPGHRQAALRTMLRHVGAVEALELLHRFAAAEEKNVRMGVANEIGRVADPEPADLPAFREKLELLSRAKDAGVRKAAKERLAKLD